MPEQPEPGFVIGGVTYPVPEIGSLNMDEAQRLFDLSGAAIEDFALPDPDASPDELAAHEADILTKVRNPGFKRALVEIAYTRGNPQLAPSIVRQRVASLNMVDVLAAFADAEGGDDTDPPEDAESTQPPSEQFSSGADDSKRNSGPDSSITSDEPDEPLASIGATKSVISSPESVRLTSAP